MDSLDPVELVMAAESELGVALPPDAHTRLAHATAAELWRAVARARTAAPVADAALPAPDDPLWAQVRGWVALRRDLPVAQVSATTPLLPLAASPLDAG